MSQESVHKPLEMIVESRGSFKMSDGFQLSYQRWSLSGATERIILGLPGGGWYSGQFREMGARLPGDVPGTVLYAIDYRGFGNSVEEGFQKGDMSSLERGFKDINEVAESVRRDNMGKKFYLFGHSAGSLVALRFAASHPDSVDGLVLAAPGIMLKGGRPPRSLVLRMLFLRLFSPGTMIDLLKYRSEEQKQSDETTSVQEDPLSAHSSYSVRFLFGGFRLIRGSLRNARQVRAPTLIIHGEADGLAAPEGAAKLMATLSSSDKTLKMFPGADHHFYDTLPPRLHSKYDEATKRQVYDAITSWLKAH